MYADLFDNYEEQLRFTPTNRAYFVFQNNYIYNDSRMEGLDVSVEQTSEIVTDLRVNKQNSQYCSEKNEAFLSIAGYYSMYQEIFASPVKDIISVYDSFGLNRKLFSYYPNPDFGGSPRQHNVLVLGGKFETTDYRDIYSELASADAEVKDCYEHCIDSSISNYVKAIARIHHRLTVIHPFPEGNGRTSRAFMNTQLVRAGITPLYIKVEDKNAYLNALAEADKSGNYDPLYEVLFRAILRCHIDLTKDLV